jgi:hypothetical protein
VLFPGSGNHSQEKPAFAHAEEAVVAIFDRIRRGVRSDAPSDQADATEHLTLEPIPMHLAPEINQRVTITTGEHIPVPSRVEDSAGGAIIVADPALPLEFGDRLIVAWERENEWVSLDTRVLGVDERASVPTVHVAAGGRIRRFDDRRGDIRREVELPLELRVVQARALRFGRELHTHTVEVSSGALRFPTTAPLAPGDVLEARIRVGEGARDEVTARVRIIRVDSVSGSWRSVCTVALDEMLRSERARLLAIADATGREIAAEPAADVRNAVGEIDVAAFADALGVATPPMQPGVATPPTQDGVGGRDEPESLSTFEGVVDWLKRRGGN